MSSGATPPYFRASFDPRIRVDHRMPETCSAQPECARFVSNSTLLDTATVPSR
jgi:hypothetical protein